jgi:catechol 2,3-dioxygenase-like lactoylglutathione lyase family enzyme
MQVKTSVKYVTIPVDNMERAVDFYKKVLLCQTVSDNQMDIPAQNGSPELQVRTVQMRLGEEMIELVEYLNFKGRAIPHDSRSNDQWVQHLAIVVQDMEQAYQHLTWHGVAKVSKEPQTLPKWNLATGDIQAFYFKDLEGHTLELVHFPQGKTDLKWHRLLEQNPMGSLFLGIDYTAIVVSKTDESQEFYNLLGLELQQDNMHVGLEQERLSDLPRVLIRASTLKGTEGMKIKLLEYINPSQGRSVPEDTSMKDLWSWQTTIAIEGLSPIIKKLEESKFSSSVFKSILPEESREPSYLIKDPSGHRLRLVEK